MRYLVVVITVFILSANTKESHYANSVNYGLIYYCMLQSIRFYFIVVHIDQEEFLYNHRLINPDLVKDQWLLMSAKNSNFVASYDGHGSFWPGNIHASDEPASPPKTTSLTVPPEC